MITVDDIKRSLRITHKLLDEEIQQNIDTALLDMSRVGVEGEVDKLTDKACELYCKAALDYQGKGDIYKRNYEELRDGMSLSVKYARSCTGATDGNGDSDV